MNDREYLEQRGLNVFVFSSEYNGMFFDEKTAGIELIHHGVRTATGGAVRLKPTPEQWDQIPKLVKRTVDKQAGTIEVLLRYEAFDFDSRVVVSGRRRRASRSASSSTSRCRRGSRAARASTSSSCPSAYFEKTYLADGRPGLFPLYPSGPMQVKPAEHADPPVRGSHDVRRPRPRASTSRSTRSRRARRSSSLPRTRSAGW